MHLYQLYGKTDNTQLLQMCDHQSGSSDLMTCPFATKWLILCMTTRSKQYIRYNVTWNIIIYMLYQGLENKDNMSIGMYSTSEYRPHCSFLQIPTTPWQIKHWKTGEVQEAVPCLCLSSLLSAQQHSLEYYCHCSNLGHINKIFKIRLTTRYSCQLLLLLHSGGVTSFFSMTLPLFSNTFSFSEVVWFHRFQ
jgi:hypothetical protein